MYTSSNLHLLGTQAPALSTQLCLWHRGSWSSKGAGPVHDEYFMLQRQTFSLTLEWRAQHF